MNRCRTCKFFDAANNADTGHCRRYPPTVQPVPLSIELPDDNNDRQADTGALRIEGALETIYPTVDAEDWCGEQRQLAFPRDEVQP